MHLPFQTSGDDLLNGGDTRTDTMEVIEPYIRVEQQAGSAHQRHRRSISSSISSYIRSRSLRHAATPSRAPTTATRKPA